MNLQNFREILKPIGQRFWPGLKVHDAPAFFWRNDRATYENLDRIGKDRVDEYVCHRWYNEHRRTKGKLPPPQPIQRLPFDSFIIRIQDEETGDTMWHLVVEVPGSHFPDHACWGLLSDDDHLVAISSEIPGCTSLDIWDTRREAVRRDERSRALIFALFEEVIEREHGANRPVEVRLRLVQD